MEWKFRKEFQIMPGVKLKYGKSGITTEFTIPPTAEDAAFETAKLKHQLFKPYDAIHEIKSGATGTMTSQSLQHLKTLLLASHAAFAETRELLHQKKSALLKDSNRLRKLENSFLKRFYKKKISRIATDVSLLTEEAAELSEQLNYTTINLEIDSEDIYYDHYNNISKAFELLTRSKKKWDFTSSKHTNRVEERTSASNTITRSEVSISYQSLDIIKSEQAALCFNNMNGGNLYFYPGFLIVYESKTKFDLISYSDLKLTFGNQRFIESEAVPADAVQVGQTWHKVNKDGSPDRRFSGNYRIPIMLYGEIEFQTASGLHETFCFSNAEFTQLFGKALEDYISSLRTAASMLEQFHK